MLETLVERKTVNFDYLMLNTCSSLCLSFCPSQLSHVPVSVQNQASISETGKTGESQQQGLKNVWPERRWI